MVSTAHARTTAEPFGELALKDLRGSTWLMLDRSYNQGVILGALSEMFRATKNADYTSSAKRIADAGISKLTDNNGILHDPCEPDCGGDGSQFKGIFARNLQILQQTSPESSNPTGITGMSSIWNGMGRS